MGSRRRGGGWRGGGRRRSRRVTHSGRRRDRGGCGRRSDGGRDCPAQDGQHERNSRQAGAQSTPGASVPPRPAQRGQKPLPHCRSRTAARLAPACHPSILARPRRAAHVRSAREAAGTRESVMRATRAARRDSAASPPARPTSASLRSRRRAHSPDRAASRGDRATQRANAGAPRRIDVVDPALRAAEADLDLAEDAARVALGWMRQVARWGSRSIRRSPSRPSSGWSTSWCGATSERPNAAGPASTSARSAP